MPFDYHDNTSVINDNYHTLTLAIPIVRDGSGTTDYRQLINKPSLEGVVLDGDLTLEDVGAQPQGNYPNSPLSDEDLEELIRDEI